MRKLVEIALALALALEGRSIGKSAEGGRMTHEEGDSSIKTGSVAVSDL